MRKINWKREICTIPNLLSLFRLTLIPVYLNLYLNAQTTRDYTMSAVILGVSCMTDLVDGKIARRYNMISNVGKVLDPLADKLLILAALTAALTGGTVAPYTPELYIAPVSGFYTLGLAAYWIYLLIPTILHCKEAIQWHISRSKI